jgi:hypothetical protein
VIVLDLMASGLRYLPGEQLRRVVLTDKQLCFGLAPARGDEEEERTRDIMLDYIPLHEISEIRQGHEDIPGQARTRTDFQTEISLSSLLLFLSHTRAISPPRSHALSRSFVSACT